MNLENSESAASQKPRKKTTYDDEFRAHTADISLLTDALVKCGWEEQYAKSFASYVIIFELHKRAFTVTY